jgi:Fic family protein
MNPQEFLNPASGRLVKTVEANWAFVPAPLPPPIVYDAELVFALSQADAALSELSGLGRQLPNPHLLIAPYMRREAVLSSRIEGTRASLSDLLIDEAGEDGQKSVHDDVREVRNYVRAMEHGLARLSELPLSLRLVRELHEQLMQGVRGDKATPGEFRRRQNWIGGPGSTEANASYVPPPVIEMTQSLHDWENFLQPRESMPPLIQCALMHVQFEAIHPFLDGNGRVGRLLITLFLMEHGRLSQPLLYLSAFIEAHRQDYYDLLQRTRTHGDWKAWLMYFLAGVRQVANDAAKQAAELLDLREQLRQRLRDNTNAIALIDALFVNPYITAGRAKNVLKKSDPTARSALEKLQDAHVIEEMTGRTWGRMYVARPILDVIDRPFD